MTSFLSNKLFKKTKHNTKVRWLSFCKSSPYSFQEMSVQDKDIRAFEKSFQIAADEMVYAIESQGSIYYRGDFLAASEAVHLCIDQFHDLLHSLKPDKSHTFQLKWSEPLFKLRSRLDSLPSPKDKDN
ncbi:hypothetical protein AB4K20DRAFT_1983956 [Rhizopus microsporus]